MSGLPLFQNSLEIKPFIRLFVWGLAVPMRKWNPKVAGATPALTYMHPIVARAISQPLRDQECTVIGFWCDTKFICDCWGSQSSLSHLCHLSNISPTGHLSPLILSAKDFFALLITSLALPVPPNPVHCVHWNSSALFHSKEPCALPLLHHLVLMNSGSPTKLYFLKLL